VEPRTALITLASRLYLSDQRFNITAGPGIESARRSRLISHGREFASADTDSSGHYVREVLVPIEAYTRMTLSCHLPIAISREVANSGLVL